MKHEAASRFDRSTMVDRSIGRFARLDVELAQKRAKADPCPLVADADSDGTIFVVDAHRNDRALEARVGHSRHRKQQLAGKECRLLGHDVTMGCRSERGKP
jgi:hypothetical protein